MSSVRPILMLMGVAIVVTLIATTPAQASLTAAPLSQQQGCSELLSPTQIPSPGLINFDNLPNSTVIGTSYLVSHGVTFEDTNTTRALIYGNEPITETQSPPNVASNDAVFPNTSSGVPMRIFFDKTKTHVGFWMGNGESVGPTGVMTAYDGAGNVICPVSNIRVPEAHTEFIGILDPLGRIASVSLDYGQTALSESIDDLYFAPHTSRATPTPTRTPLPTWTPIPTATPTAGPTPTPFPVLPVYAYLPPVEISPIVLPSSDLSLHGIEITEGIQCFNTANGLATCPDNSLPVVTKKDATARIYLKYTGPGSSLSNVPVALYIRANSVWYTATLTGKAKPTLSQANDDDSADVWFYVNFSNDVLVDFYAVVDPNNTIAETNEGNNRYPAGAGNYITLNFRRRDALKIVGQRVRYHPTGYAGNQYAGGWAVNGGAADWFEQLLPIRNNGINYSVKSGYLNWTTSVSGGTSAQNSAGQHALISTLNTMWVIENAFAWLFGGGAFTGADHVYGWVPSQGYGGGHADMPVYPHAGGLGVVGIGTDAPGASTDNPGAGALIFGHELVHDYNVYHTDTGADDCGSDDSNSDFPYGTSSIQEFGYNPTTGKIYNPANAHDLMSYCPAGGSKEGWISPFTWNRMFNNFPAAALRGATAANQAHASASSTAQIAESLVVNATLFNPAITSGGGQLGELYRFNTVIYPPSPGDYAVELRTGATVLYSQTFTVSFKSEYSAHPGADPPGDPNPSPQADVSFVMPWVNGATSVVLLQGNQVLDTRLVSANAPQVLITSPTQVVTWTSGTYTVTWTASDADGGPLSYSVLYSNDSGANWVLLANELTDQFFGVDADALAGGSDARIRVVASDGVNIGYDETDVVIVVPNKAPYAIITNPLAGQVVAPGALLVLQGTATDLEDGGLPDSALHWSNDRQGSLGIGPSLPLNVLQAGAHVITLTAIDSHGQTTNVSVPIYVGHRVYLPVVLK